MTTFTPKELDYLRTQPLARFATASADAQPDVAVVTFGIDGDDVVTGGFDIAKTVRYRFVQANPRAVVIIDDLASTNPWSPRGIKIRGSVTIEAHDGGERFRIAPEVIWSWGIEEPSNGIPQMSRRTV
jgi:pyridoxamine 5'-phosphate oxidase family protein